MGAEICGQPLSLASALAKIAGAAQAIPNPEAERHPATAPLFIINPLSGHGMDNLFSTHPATENRIAALQALAREMAAAAAPARPSFLDPRPAVRGPHFRGGARRWPVGLALAPSAGEGLGSRRLAWNAVAEVLKRRVPLDDVLAARRRGARRPRPRRSRGRSRSSPSAASARSAMPSRPRLDRELTDRRLFALLAIGGGANPDPRRARPRRGRHRRRARGEPTRGCAMRRASSTRCCAGSRAGARRDPRRGRSLAGHARLAARSAGAPITGRRRPRPSPRRTGTAPRIDLTGQGRSGGAGRSASAASCCRPAASACAERARGPGAARLRGGRVVGAGCRRGAAGAPARRRAGRSGRRPLRGARRQDRPARRRRRAGARRRPFGPAPGAAGGEPARRLGLAVETRRRPTRRASTAGAFRRRPPRRALLGDGHDPPPSRRRLDEGRGGHRASSRPPAPPPRPGGGADEARRPARLLHLLARAGGGRGPGRGLSRPASGLRRAVPVAPEEVGGLAEARLVRRAICARLPCHLRLGERAAQRARRILRRPLYARSRADDPLLRSINR